MEQHRTDSLKWTNGRRIYFTTKVSYLSVAVIRFVLVISVRLYSLLFFHRFFHFTLGLPAQIVFRHRQTNVLLLFNWNKWIDLLLSVVGITCCFHIPYLKTKAIKNDGSLGTNVSILLLEERFLWYEKLDQEKLMLELFPPLKWPAIWTATFKNKKYIFKGELKKKTQTICENMHSFKLILCWSTFSFSITQSLRVKLRGVKLDLGSF